MGFAADWISAQTKISTMSNFERVELSKIMEVFSRHSIDTLNAMRNRAKRDRTKERIIAQCTRKCTDSRIHCCVILCCVKTICYFTQQLFFLVFYVILINVISWLDWIALLRYAIIIRAVKQCISMNSAHDLCNSSFLVCIVCTANPFATSIRCMEMSGGAEGPQRCGWCTVCVNMVCFRCK